MKFIQVLVKSKLGKNLFRTRTIESSRTMTNTNTPTRPFNLVEIKSDKAVDTFIDLLEGKVTGMHVKSILPQDYCRDLEARFHSSPLKKPRADGVPGFEAGVTQYKKDPKLLSKMAYNQHGKIRDMMGEAENPLTSFFRELAIHASLKGYLVRPASYGAEAMPIVRAIQWIKETPDEKMLLKLHDDLAQAISPLNKGFEIQQVERLIAYNFYPRAVKNSGQLSIYDWQPTKEEREQLGCADTGFPYKMEDLPPNVRSHEFNQETGDLIAIDGSYVHGVTVGRDECDKRLCINGFAAVLKNKHVVLYA